ncbi:MAG: M56 family metallopeptidase, partial [Gemmatimonadaceae bacterium]
MSDFIAAAASLWENTAAVATAGMISLKASIILLIAFFAARLLRPLSAAKRHLLWSAGIGAALIVPLVTLSLPSWRIPVHYAAARAPVLSDSLGASVAVASAPEQDTPSQSATLLPILQTGVSAQSSVGRERADVSAADVLLAVWLLGALLSLWPWIAGVIGRSRLSASATDLLPASWERSLRTLRAQGLVPARVRVLAAADCSTPMTWGVVRPIVLVPVRTEWQENERRNALLHEFAHVRRVDYLCKLGTRILCSIYWFNPLAWIAARAERLTREQACDDAVLRAGSRPSTYAQQLLDVAHGQQRPIMAAAALTMARRSNLSRRLRAILDAGHDRSPTGRGFASIAVGAVCVVLPPLATLVPDWVRVVPVPNEVVMPGAAVQAPVSSAPRSVTASRTEAAPRTEADVQPRMLASPQQVTECPTTGKRSSTNIQSHSEDSPDRRRRQVKWTDGNCRIELDARGMFTLSPNADDVIALSAGGYFELEQDDGRVERRVRIVRAGGGG